MCKVISGFIKQSSNGNSGSGGGGSKDINELKQKVAELQKEVAANTAAIGLLENGKAGKTFQTIVFTKESSSYTDVSCGDESLDTDAEALYGVMQQIISETGEYVTCKLVVDNNGNDTETLGLLSYSWSDAVIEGHTMRTHAYTIAVGALVFLFEIVEETQAGTFTAGNITKTDLSSSL